MKTARSAPPSGVLWLEAPDFASLDTVAQRPSPFVLWPVGPRTILAHWMDEAVRRNVAEVRIVAPDRPHLVRAALAGGAYWSRAIHVFPQRPADAPAFIEPMDHLPGTLAGNVPTDGRTLLLHWLALQRAWILARDEREVSLDIRHPSGAWIGPKARIHPSARLVPPCWIGAYAEIGANTEIGPNATVGEHSVIDEGASVRESAVLATTYVGERVNVTSMIADGPVLLDAARGTRVALTDRFILASLREWDLYPGPLERVAAAALWILACVVGVFRPHGPLLVQRRRWLFDVLAGRMRLVGVLPRSEQALNELPPDVQAVLRHAPRGVVSFADTLGCHRVDDPDEWLHALYQAGGADPDCAAHVRHALWSILWKTQPQS